MREDQEQTDEVRRMSGRYMNAREKDDYIILCGIRGWALDRKQREYPVFGGGMVRNALSLIAAWALRALQRMEKEMDPDWLAGIKRRARGLKLQAISEGDPRWMRDYYMAAPEDLDAILKDPLSRCMCCDLEGADAARCDVRKALGHMAVCPANAGRDGCPYRSDL